jgi:pimeloyl-ACP methyl ester carboxylesterase
MQITVQGAQIYYNERGAGVPTLFLHGVPDSAELWNPIIDRLQGQFRCIAVDLPGLTTRSGVPDGFDYTLPSMAKFVDGVITALKISEPVNLVFGDFGGLYALAFAITYPNKVRKLALAGSVGLAPDYEWHQTAKMWRAPILGDLSMMSLREGMFKNAMKAAAPSLTPEYWRDVYALSMKSGAVKRNILRQYRALNPKEYGPWEAKLLELTKRVPMIVLWGDKDAFISSAFADRFGAREVNHYAQYGHWIAVEAPDEIAGKLSSFLA